jgi:hypothetical protein
VCGVGYVPRFVEAVACLINRRLPRLDECEPTRYHVSDPRPNVVMHAQVSAGGEGNLRRPDLELTVEFSQIPGEDLSTLTLGVIRDVSTFD